MFSKRKKKKHDSNPLLMTGESQEALHSQLYANIDRYDVYRGGTSRDDINRDCASRENVNHDHRAKKLNVVVVGADGATGRQVVKMALQRGHGVTALVRNEKTPRESRHGRLQIHLVDVFSAQDMVPHFAGKDVVISCLGNVETATWRPTTLYTDSIEEIIGAMKETHIGRLMCVTSWYTKYKTRSKSLLEKMAYWTAKPFQLLVQGTLDNMAAMERYIMSCDDINYTIVRPPMLTDGPLSGSIIAREGQRVQYNSLLKSCREGRLSRASLANFMMDCLEIDRWDRKGVALDQKRRL